MSGNLGDVIISLISLFICMIVGYVLRKRNIINKSFNEGVTGLIMKVTLPCVILNSMQKQYSKDIVLNIIIVFILSVLIHFFTLFVGVFICKILNTPIKEKGIIYFVMTFTNLSFLGFPVIKAMYGEGVLFYGSIALMVFNIITFTLGVHIITIGYEKKTKTFSLRGLISNVPILATIIGLLFFVLQITLPKAITTPVKLLGDLTTPLSMILVGSILADVEIKNIFSGKMIYLITFVRLVLIPILLYFILKPFLQNIEGGLILKMLCIFAGMPAAALTAILAVENKSNSDLGASYVFFTTLCSLITLPILFFFF